MAKIRINKNSLQVEVKEVYAERLMEIDNLGYDDDLTTVATLTVTVTLVIGGNRVSKENNHGSNSTVLVEIEKGDVAAGESSNLEGDELEKTTKFVASNETHNTNTEMSETKDTQNISYVKEKTDATKIGFKGDTQTDETSDSSSGIGPIHA
ncbi:unnamed protein product [Sphenostylis stenocarpa]|uniref:Uncharacterized protein n=1 Tax=Sphenostylis stenocarpa TaxID=92480 RepID=A0AA86SG66_9FABA|nr:unnamed protein product [Sphenostylis stenocarpa]